MRLRYFDKSEFIMGTVEVYDKMDECLLMSLDDLRNEVGQPLHINSSYRSEEYNKKIGGSPKSKHLLGKAVDLHCTDSLLRLKIVKNALPLGFTVGVAKTFIHLDLRETQIMFTY